jgi:hypothetical protein
MVARLSLFHQEVAEEILDAREQSANGKALPARELASTGGPAEGSLDGHIGSFC